MAWRPDRWLLGVPLLALVWAGGTWWAGPRLEDELKRSIQEQPGSADLRQAGARLDLRGRDAVVVTDFALPEPARQAIERAAMAVSGVRRVALEMAMPFAMQPFRLMIRRSPAGIVLRGGVPAGGVHARLLEGAVSISTPDGIDDRLAPGLGAPPGFEPAAQAALRLAGHLASGEVTLSDQVLSIQGEAADFAAYDAIMSDLLELPPGYATGRIDVVPPEAKPFAWAAVRGPDGITFEGFVPSEPSRKALREAVEAALPGTAVLDRMQTARGLDPAVDFDALGRLAVRSLSQLDAARASYDGRQFALAGVGAARDLVEGLPDAVRRDLPAGVKPGTFAIKPVPASPYRFAAQRSRGRITLTGYTPDPAIHDAMRGALERLLPTEAVVDELHVADGAPEGFAVAAGFALESLSQLADGKAELTDRRMTLQGRALYPAMAKQTERRTATALPPGWSGAATITAEPIEKPLETGLCADLLADAIRRDPVRFEPGKAEINTRSRPGIDTLADVVRRCGPTRIRILVRPEAADENEAARTLARQRAAALAAALGGNTARLSPDLLDMKAVPRGDGVPVKADGDRIAFVVEPERTP